MNTPVTTVNEDGEGVLRTAQQVIAGAGATGTRVATGPSDQYAASSVTIKGVIAGGPTVEPGRFLLTYS